VRRISFLLGLILVGSPLWSVSHSVILAHRVAPSSHSAISSDAQPFLTVPAETLVKARILTGMHTLVSRVDDPIAAEMTDPVYVDGRLALPAGTLFDGRITSVHPAGRVGRNAELGFRFDRVTLPDGQDIPVSAVLASLEKSPGLQGRLDSEGHLRGRRRRSWKGFLTGFLTVGGLSAAKLAVAGSAALTVAAPASAAAFVGYELFMRHGGDVSVPPQTRCRIRLNNSLTVQSLG
jgi:hypothetical protein